MGKPAVSLRNKMIALCAAGLLSCGLLPLIGYAADDDSVAGPLAGPGYENDARSASPNSASNEPQQVDASQVRGGSDAAPTLASALAGSATSIVSADVALDSAEPIVGSFTVDGLTYALNDGGVTLVSVGATFVVAPYEGSADSGDGNAIAIPSSVTYDGVAYPVTAIGSYAFYLSGATDVALSASVVSVDDRAFRSSDVERVEVAAGNPNLASFDGCLYDSQLTRLLLIPEGRKGSVLLSCETEVVEASKFSHCSLVEAISVEEGGAAFSSWEGCLYSSDGTTLLRVPAGATEITVHDGCTTVAAGAMEVHGDLVDGNPGYYENGWFYWLNKEGDQYPYWSEVCGVDSYDSVAHKYLWANAGCLVKLDGGGEAASWWLRRVPALNTLQFNAIRATDGVQVNAAASTPQGVAFAFCL